MVPFGRLFLQKQPSPKATVTALYATRTILSYTTPGDTIRVTGDYRYTTYAAGATLGFIGRHTALSISYQVPLGTYSRNLTFDHSIELEFAVRP